MTLKTAESRNKKLEEINTDPAKQDEWNADVKNTTMRGTTYGVPGRTANPEREGMDDDVKRTQVADSKVSQFLGTSSRAKGSRPTSPGASLARRSSFLGMTKQGFSFLQMMSPL